MQRVMAFLFQQEAAQTEQMDNATDQQQLFVFGYHCKLFRDDEKALAIDAGEHLIPWMGDESNKIDRSVNQIIDKCLDQL